MKIRKPWRSFPVPVAHTTYIVDLFKEQPKVEGDKVQGYCDYAKRRIGLWINPNEEAFRAAFWHEWEHGFFHETGMDAIADNHSVIEGLAISIMSVRLKVPHL